MSRASKEAKRNREAAQRAKNPTVHVKLPIWLRGTLEVQNSEKPNRLVSRPSYKHPPKLEI